jgi:hypothetical protein
MSASETPDVRIRSGNEVSADAEDRLQRLVVTVIPP